MNLDQQIEAAGQNLALGAIAVVGAGLSIDSRFPLTGGLNTLLWDALDSDPAARAMVAASLGRPDAPSKGLVGDSWNDVLVAWEAVPESAFARLRFQRQFSVLDSERAPRPSPAHEALARLVHAGVVECVVSLNWDTALEHAYSRLYGVPVPEGVLFKPHGDAAHPESDWTLPHEPGRVPPQVSEVVQRLAAGHARTLLMVGYSERDQVVVERLVQPLDESWRTVRVGPSAIGAHDVTAVAEVALPQLAEPYASREDAASWHIVTYRGSRDIQAALNGERLDPRDVNACPKLAEVDLLVQALRTERAVVMNGPTGCGKSITAYQALRRLTDDGFETLRLRDDARRKGIRSWLGDLRSFPRPKVLLLDDAQDMSPDTVRELAELADDKTLVLVVGIDHVAGGVRTLRLGAGSAVARLARWVREERHTLFPLIRALDENVGTHADDLFFDRRIDVAEREETPWRFFYTMTGGWRRVRRSSLELRDAERADLALLAVAVAQIAGVDAGVDHATLMSLVRKLGRDDEWLKGSLLELNARRLVLESDGRLRCAHLQSARSVISWMLHPPSWNTPLSTRPAVPPIASAAITTPVSASTLEVETKPSEPDLPQSEIEADREAACALITLVLDMPDTSLRGLAWLAGRDMPGDARGYLESKGVLGPMRDEQLALCALATPADGDVAAAAKLLSDTIWYSRNGEVVATVKAHDNRIREWYAAITPQNAWALGNLANDLCGPDKEYAAQVAGYAAPRKLARLVLDGGWPHTASTGHALNRLCNVGGHPVRDAIRPHLDVDAYTQMLNTGDPEFWRTISLLDDFMFAHHEHALDLFESVAPRLARQFQADPVRQWNDTSSFVIHLGYGPHFLRGPKRPAIRATEAVRNFIRSLDRQRIAETLATPNELWGQLNFDGFVSLLSEADPTTFRAIAGLVNLTQFEESLRVHPDDPNHAALFLLYHLQEFRPDQVHAILDRLEPDLKYLFPLIAYMAPDIATRALQRGLPLDFGLDHDQWELAAAILERLHAHDPVTAAEVAYSNQESMSIGLAAENFHSAWEGLRHWTAACDRAAPGLLDEVIAELPIGAVAGWARALRRPKKYTKSRRPDIAPLVHRAALVDGHAKLEAMDLLRRFPSIA
ncbi:hypothetical protein [Arthrobacter sp. HLT1-21]